MIHDQPLERVAILGITLRTTSVGRQYVRCPQCERNARHGHNRTARKLAVDIRPDGAVAWYP